MDSVDFDIFRFLFPGGVIRWHGTDPRISMAQVAAQAGIGSNAVRQRIVRWRQVGFLRGYDVRPNPYLFGANLVATEIPVPDPLGTDRVLEELGLIEGVTDAWETFHEDRRVVIVRYIAETPIAVARREKLLARLTPTGTLPRRIALWVYPCTHELSLLDWRIVRAFAHSPQTSFHTIAREVGITPKTLARRYGELLDSNALWWVPVFDFTQFPAAVLVITPNDPRGREKVVHKLRNLFPHWAPIDSGSESLYGDGIAGYFLVECACVTAVDRLVREIRAIPGVDRVTRYFPGRNVTYREWFDLRVEERLRSGGLDPFPAPARRRGAFPPTSEPGSTGRRRIGVPVSTHQREKPVTHPSRFPIHSSPRPAGSTSTSA